MSPLGPCRLIRQAYLEVALLYLDSTSERFTSISALQQAEREETKAQASSLTSPEKKKKSRVGCSLGKLSSRGPL